MLARAKSNNRALVNGVLIATNPTVAPRRTGIIGTIATAASTPPLSATPIYTPPFTTAAGPTGTNTAFRNRGGHCPLAGIVRHAGGASKRPGGARTKINAVEPAHHTSRRAIL